MTGTVQQLLGRAQPTIRAIVEAVIAEHLGRADLAGVDHVEATLRTLEGKLGGMSTFMACGMLTTTLAVEAASVAAGSPLRQRSIPDRQRWLASLRGAPVGLLRDFVMFWEKMTVFAFWCHREEATGQHVDTDK